MPRVRRSAADARLDEKYGPEFLESLARSLRIVNAFDPKRPRMTLSDVAKLVDLPRATVRRTLYTLKCLGYVEENEDLYRLTPKILTLATSYLASDSNVRALRHAVEQIAAESGCFSLAGVQDGASFIIVARVSPQNKMSLNLSIGDRLPIFHSATGRVLLAEKPEKEIDALLSTAELKKITPHTVVDKTKIKAAIQDAKKRGYSVVDNEVVLGFRSIAVPVRRFDGAVVAAIQIGVDSYRVPLKATIKDCLPLLKERAESLSSQLI